ncbi:FUN14 domain-containing protein 1-like isoform X2 [Limulus polyphemus]|uniref:FUN14 domain-containing protein 1-like isoform X2 n=1 Tax=Limulus polyphemus TaxID=6850 RepID=A0ABM1SHT2_LIMPO|nr:FUN14 domain-containing protein 1-like isoform X2 [Limulus polyphemus]
MKRGKDQDPDDVFEILDVRGSAKNGKNWFQHFLGDITKASTAKQITVGGITGWCTGFVFTKIGKVAATAVGGSLLLIQGQKFVKENVVLATGFAGGFLIGIASS